MDFQQTVEILTTLPRSQSVLIIGKHGIGKSDAVREAAKILGIPIIDQRLSTSEVGDLKGMPFSIDGRTSFSPPDWFPLTEEDAKDLAQKHGTTVANFLRHSQSGILFLDEIDRATREVQQAAFELALDHRLNMKFLPQDWRVVSAVNADGDIYHVTEMDPAFINRFFIINFNPTREEWFNFARKDGRVHSAIVDFLTKYPNLMDPTKEIIENSPGQQIYTRRAYEKFSIALMNHEKLHLDGKINYSLLDKSPKGLTMLTLMAQGFLGTTTGVQFRNFVETDYESLNGDIILNKFTKDIGEKIKKLVDGKKIIELGSYNQLIINYVQDKNLTALSPKQSKNLLSFIQIVPKECIADFYKRFNAECKTVCDQWYQGPDRKDIVSCVVGALANPQTGRGA